MEKLKWETVKRKINDLVPFEHNPRKMTEDQVAQLTTSLEKFDLVEIPAIDFDDTILAGHQRLRVMQTLGRGDEEIDVRIPNRKLTEEEYKEYNVRSNQNKGMFDFEKLASLFDEEELLDLGFSVNDLGMSIADPMDEWDGMPEYNTDDIGAQRQIIISFKNDQAVRDFAELLKQTITDKTKSLWFPEEKNAKQFDKEY